VLDPDDPVTLRRLSDLRDSNPADVTLRNLLTTLTSKLDLCARLPVLAYEADREGHVQAAAAFRALADTEQRLLDDLLAGLRRHLERLDGGLPTAGATTAHGGKES
jgi:hypothetical protein